MNDIAQHHVEASRLEQHQLAKPKKVRDAVKLLYLTLGIGFLRSIMEMPLYAQTAPLTFLILTTCLTFGVIWFIIYMIGRGHNWARIIFLVMFILGVPLSIQPLLESLTATPISGLLGIAQAVMQTIALVFIFQKPSSDWFRERKLTK